MGFYISEKNNEINNFNSKENEKGKKEIIVQPKSDSFIDNIKNIIRFVGNKHCSTLAAALVFFFVLGIIPFLYLASLTLTLFNVDLSVIINSLHLENYNEAFSYINEIVDGFNAKTGIIMAVIAIYSSGNLFYRLRRSGELIYNYKGSGAIFTRIAAVIVMFLMQFLLAGAVIGYVYIKSFFNNIFYGFGTAISLGISVLTLYAGIILINVFCCPFRLRAKETLLGSLYTAAFMIIGTLGFYFYINNISNYSRFYGKVAFWIVFLTWIYLIMQGLVGGIIINVYLMGRNGKTIKKIKKKSISI